MFTKKIIKQYAKEFTKEVYGSTFECKSSLFSNYFTVKRGKQTLERLTPNYLMTMFFVRKVMGRDTIRNFGEAIMCIKSTQHIGLANAFEMNMYEKDLDSAIFEINEAVEKYYKEYLSHNGLDAFNFA